MKKAICIGIGLVAGIGTSAVLVLASNYSVIGYVLGFVMAIGVVLGAIKLLRDGKNVRPQQSSSP